MSGPIDLIGQLQEEVAQKKLTIVGICAFGIARNKGVDALIFVPEAKVMAVGDPTARVALAARFVKLIGMTMTTVLRKLFASFDLQDTTDSLGVPVDEAIRRELEHLRVATVMEANKVKEGKPNDE